MLYKNTARRTRRTGYELRIIRCSADAAFGYNLTQLINIWSPGLRVLQRQSHDQTVHCVHDSRQQNVPTDRKGERRLFFRIFDSTPSAPVVATFVSVNLLKPTGHVMHQQFNIQQLYALSTLYLCVLYSSENKQRLVPLTA